MTGKRYVHYSMLTEDQLIAEIQRLEGENRALIGERDRARDLAVRSGYFQNADDLYRKLSPEEREAHDALAAKAHVQWEPEPKPDVTDFNVHLTDPGQTVALMQQLAGEVGE